MYMDKIKHQVNINKWLHINNLSIHQVPEYVNEYILMNSAIINDCLLNSLTPDLVMFVWQNI